MNGVEISLQTISKTYSSNTGDVLALAPTSLTIGKGEFVVVVGPSGCGKTTLLRMIAGLIRPTTGAITIGNQALWQGSGKNSAAIGELRTVVRNIALPLELRGMARRERMARAEELIELVGLKGFENAYPHELSGGMAQRAAIARALSHNPRILLMDEPFGALDAMTRDAMNFELQRIWMNLQSTVVFVTHSIPESVFLADRVISLAARPGRIVKTTDVSFPRPRQPELEQSGEFQAHVGVLRHLLHS